MTTDVIELRVPPKAQFLPVIRANIGVIAGGVSFDYDQIIQLRTAVAEAFEIAIGCVSQGEPSTPPQEVVVRFSVNAGGIEVLVTSDGPYEPPSGGEEGLEIRALLESLVDQLEMGSGAPGTPIVRMAKYK